MDTAKSLLPFFEPRAVAMIGASRDPASIGSRLLASLQAAGYRGQLHPVHPQAQELGGLPVCPSVRALPEGVDLAIIALPRDAVLGVVEECADRSIPAIVVISAGFSEVDAAGRELQDRLAERVRARGLRLIGPNCLGLLTTDPAVRLNATFTGVFPPTGQVAMSSESGAVGFAILAAARQMDLGISSFVSVGNRADVSSNDLLEYWENDPRTELILLYLESFGNPRRFARIARRVSRRKPIVAVKAGRTVAGRRAAGSHTAALAAADVAVEALFRQTGVIRAETLAEMFDLARVLSSQPLPRGRRVGIVTNAGGPAILCADACEAGGLVVPELSSSTRSRLASFLPAAASTRNPVDAIASATAAQFRQVLEALLTSGEVDAIITIYVSAGLTDAEAVGQAIRDSLATARGQGTADLPLLVCWMPEQPFSALSLEGDAVIPCFAFPEVPARVLSKLAAHAEWRLRAPGQARPIPGADSARARRICIQALGQRGTGWLTTIETREVLQAMGLPLAPGGVAVTAGEAAELACRLGFPVAVKLASHQVIHKTEMGGVHLHLATADAVRQAFAAIRDRLDREGKLDAMEGVLVQPMVSGGTEVMVGVAQDPLFGPLIAFGLGGIHVEILGDVCFRVTPLTEDDAGEMVRSIRGWRLFQGYRGHPPADVPALEDLLLRVSRLVEEVPEIHELDLNPIFVLTPGEGCRIVDARIRVEPPAGLPR